MLKRAILAVLIFSSCSSLNGESGSSGRAKKLEPFVKKNNGKVLKGPCINLPFIDQNYPELLNELIRLYQPKVGIKSAFKITKRLLKDKNKLDSYTLDSKSGRLCKVKGEFGYSFKAIKVLEKK